jgi:hypothetical protein
MNSANEKETLERVIRLESRMVQLGDHVGANLRTKQRIDIRASDTAACRISITIDSLDVSLSRIYQEVNLFYQSNPAFKEWCIHSVPVFWKGKQVMQVYL